VSGTGNVIKHNGGPGVRIGEAGALTVPVQNRVLTNQICENASDEIQLAYGGNDLLAPPEVFRGYNAIELPGGGLVGVVSGQIGYVHPPDVPTRIQVFYDTPEVCSAYYGMVHVLGTETAWTLVGEPLPSNALVYATETSRGPNVPPQLNMQTSGMSDAVDWGWWQWWNNWCDVELCPWLGTEDNGRSASWIDYDSDGLIDLFICNANGDNLLLRNVGDGVLELSDVVILAASGSITASAAWADVDNDGDQDVYLVNSGSANKLFLNDGQGDFADVTPDVLADAGPGRCAVWGDYDVDGDLDLFLTNYGTGDLLFQNNGDIEFSINEPVEEPGWEQYLSTGAAWGDYDNDGDPDLYIVIDGAPNLLLRNDLEMGFTNATVGPEGDPGTGRGVVWADFQNDGLLDLYIVNHDEMNRMLRNTGILSYPYEDITAGPEGDLGPGRGVSAGDVDLDGDLDLYITNDPDANLLLLNDGHGQFSIIDDPEPMPSGNHFACPQADCDQDGDVDLFVVDGAVEGDNVYLMNTQANGNHWLHIDLEGVISNRSGIGCRIEMTTTDDRGRSVQTREVTAGTGSMGQGSLTEEFGLGDAEVVETLRVFWPSGLISELFVVESDQVVVLVEPVIDDVDDGPRQELADTALLGCAPNPIRTGTLASFALEKPARVSLRVHDAGGRLVRVLADGYRAGGRHEITWNGRDFQDRPVPTGVYFLRFTSGDVQQQRTITLIR
jgi:hypothetical protein